jgi:DNA repair photolyase
MDITEVKAASILTPQKFGSLSGRYDYSLNPYAGCAFRCSYCYVPKFPSSRHDDYKQWGNWVEVKINAPELIRKERFKAFGSSIFFSSATDPYQYLELKYRLSRRCLQELLKYRPKKLTLHTRSHLILQDLELLKEFGDGLSVGVSITTDNETVQREFEPGAPSIARRIDMIRQLRSAGIRVHGSLAPLLPCDPEKFVALLKPHIKHLWVDGMRYPEINTRPEMVEKYKSFFEPARYQETQEWIYREITGRHANGATKKWSSSQSSSSKKSRSSSQFDKLNSAETIKQKSLARAPNELRKQAEEKQLTLLLTNI